MNKFRKFIELSKWFHSESEPYVLGDRIERKKPSFKKSVMFRVAYPLAWCKFMWYSRSLIINASLVK